MNKIFKFSINNPNQKLNEIISIKDTLPECLHIMNITIPITSIICNCPIPIQFGFIVIRIDRGKQLYLDIPSHLSEKICNEKQMKLRNNQ